MSDQVGIVGELNTLTGYLEMKYYIRPNDLVADNRAGVITAIDRTTDPDYPVITVSTFPSHFSSQTTFDFIKKRSPNKIIDYDKSKTAADSAAKTLTFASDDVPSTLVAGDYVMAQDETIVPQMPVEMVPILAQRVAIKILEHQGDGEALQLAKADLEQMEENAFPLIDNRVEGSPKKINNFNSLIRLNTKSYPKRGRY
jgi:hypothetical protein